MKSLMLFVVVSFFSSTAVFAQNANHPCGPIVKACKAAGFIKGDWKKGDGLYRDCVAPIVQGKTTVPGATKPLPSFTDANVISACKTARPQLATGKVGS